MKKIMLAALPLAALALSAVPAHADSDSDFAGPVNAADNWNFSAGVVCMQEVAVVPVLGDWVGDHDNNCSNGNVIDHSK